MHANILPLAALACLHSALATSNTQPEDGGKAVKPTFAGGAGAMPATPPKAEKEPAKTEKEPAKTEKAPAKAEKEPAKKVLECVKDLECEAKKATVKRELFGNIATCIRRSTDNVFVKNVVIAVAELVFASADIYELVVKTAGLSKEPTSKSFEAILKELCGALIRSDLLAFYGDERGVFKGSIFYEVHANVMEDMDKDTSEKMKEKEKMVRELFKGALGKLADEFSGKSGKKKPLGTPQ